MPTSPVAIKSMCSSNATNSDAMSHRCRWFVALSSASLLFWIAISWPAVQDDAFIHLRYAEHFLAQHLISYDGVHRTFGVSSLFYVALLAALRNFTTSPLLPRTLSSAFHLAVFAGLAAGIIYKLRDSIPLPRLLALVYLAVLAMPSAVRWLDDGMESSLVLCFVALFVFTISCVAHRSQLRATDILILGLFGFFGVLLRVEMLLPLTAGGVALFASRRSISNEPNPRVLRPMSTGAAPLIGALLAAALIFALMHALLPDTAVAKASGLQAWRSSALATASVFASSMSFGMMSLVLWLISLMAVWNRDRRLNLAVLAINSVFPITLLLAIMRGQAIQGIRYFDWLLAFSLLWNILEVAWLSSSSQVIEYAPRHLFRLERLLLRVVKGAAVILVISWPIESALFLHVFNDHKRGLAEFRSEHLDQLRGLNLAAFDIGYIGYFTGAQVCDFAGLVDGRSFARLSYSERTAYCAALHPAMVFGNLTQLGDFGSDLDLSQWSICASYPLNNLRKSDMHYLVAPPDHVAQVCSATGQRPQPLAPLLSRHSPTP